MYGGIVDQGTRPNALYHRQQDINIVPGLQLSHQGPPYCNHAVHRVLHKSRKRRGVGSFSGSGRPGLRP